jgi:hypothetical protein
MIATSVFEGTRRCTGLIFLDGVLSSTPRALVSPAWLRRRLQSCI